MNDMNAANSLRDAHITGFSRAGRSASPGMNASDAGGFALLF
jgi:hypothetical protein